MIEQLIKKHKNKTFQKLIILYIICSIIYRFTESTAVWGTLAWRTSKLTN